MDLIHYIIVRKDLPLGVIAAMITHAAGESAPFYQDPEDGRFKHAIAVVLEAKGENGLVKAEKHLKANDIQYVVVYENGGPYAGQFMAIGLVPGDARKLRPVMAEFQTLKALDNPESGR